MMLKKIFIIYGYGLTLLVVAIVLNIIAKQLGIATWYDFILATQPIDIISYLFLFGVYPLALGGVIYMVSRR